MRRVFFGLGLGVLAFVACTSNDSSPASDDGGLGGDAGNVCQAPAVTAACTSCLAANCAAPASAAQTDCAGVISCYCACNLGDTCCVQACEPDVSRACLNGAQVLANCASTSCANQCTVTIPGTCTPSDGGGASDAGDAAPPDAAPVCNRHAPAGFSQVVVSNGVEALLTGAAPARSQQMVLDENDDPMFAYASADSSAAWSIDFVRWDACAGQFTAPIQVDALHPGATQPDVSISYDPSTNEIGIAYVKPTTQNNWADDFGDIWLATMKAPATTFTLQQLSAGYADYLSAGGPSIAMGGGRVYIGYWQGPYPESDDDDLSGLAWFLSSTATPSSPPYTGPNPAPDGGVGDAAAAPDDAGTADAGAAPPHYFTYDAVPYVDGLASGFNGFVFPQEGSGEISVAIDSSGVPAVALYQSNAEEGFDLLFWRTNTASAVRVYSFDLDDEVDVSLAFEGTKPRIAGHMDIPMEADASAVAPDSLKFFASNDGVHWSSGANLSNNDGAQSTAFTSALAVDGMGNAAIVSDINQGVGNGMACGANPYVATSSDEDDGGAVWTACGVDTGDAHEYTVGSASAAYGASRLKGTLTLSFVTNAGDEDAGADQTGIIYWQHP